MRSTDDLLREFVVIREHRDALRSKRAALFCVRAEPVTRQDYEDAAAEARTDPLATFEFPAPTQAEPCWKMARKWKDSEYRSARFYLDPPPSEWCDACRERQEVSDAYREAVRRHGGALRGLLRRGKSLLKACGYRAYSGPDSSLREAWRSK